MIVKKHLSRQEAASGIRFFFQITNVLLLIFAFRMDLRIAGSADRDLTVGRTNIADQVDRMAVIP